MKNLMKILPALLIAVIFFSCQSKQEKANEESIDAAEKSNDEKFQTADAEKDADFVAQAVASNIAEIEIAQLGVQRSDDAGIKEVGRMLEEQHNKLLGDLQTLASKKAITVPAVSDNDDLKKIEDLNKEDDIKDFNKEWCKTLVKKHEKSIENFETRMQKTEDADLKALINGALPHMREHLEKIKSLNEKLADASK